MQLLKIMEDIFVDDSKSNVSVGCTDKPKVAEMAKGNMRSSGRRTLADISNIPLQPSTSNNNPHRSSNTIKEHNKQLQKEKAALMKLLSEKNKIIEESRVEGHKLRVTLQKIQEQNLQLAQSNTQMLMELNSVKERNKALNHELGCKNGLISVMKLDLENRTCQTNDADNNKATEVKETETEVSAFAENNEDKLYITSKRHKSKSLVPSVEKVQGDEVGKNRRIQTRRQSSIFKVDEPKPIKDTIEIENVDDDDDDKMKVNDLIKSKEEGDDIQDYKPQENRKTFVSRPLREAAKKVQSYKEIKVNMKMRRDK
ncbi:unnamed protein product [Lactuca saligna]|uniref:Shugoshin C-terminal domain-containing protein n=1 Tax=Lactuca saligna TaxID=75948 RepID=A0AA35V627_LACSI|nr:unnamed protein product [Lactuca saligna]